MNTTKIVVGACNPSIRLELANFFLVKNCMDVIRIAIPESVALQTFSEFWIFHAKLKDGRILASHRVLNHIEFCTHDELIDKGLALEELLNG